MRRINRFNRSESGFLRFENSSSVIVVGNPTSTSLWSFFKLTNDGIYRYSHVDEREIDVEWNGALKIVGVDLL